MSIINRMLQELDRRNAVRADAPAQALTGKVRPVAASPRRVGSDMFWKLMAVIMAIAVGWVAWLAWHLTPRSVVTPLALQSAGKSRPISPAPVAEAPKPPAAAAEPAAPAPAAKAAPAPAAKSAAPPAAKAPAAQPAAKAAVPTPPQPKPGVAAAPVPPKPVPPKPAVLEKPAVVAEAKPSVRPAPVPAPAPPRAAPAEGRIDKSVAATPRERAEREQQRALALVNQGRVVEGLEGLQNALSLDPSLESARQTMVSLLIEAKRYDEAVRALSEGLALKPSHSAFAMLLARLHVERGDISTALSVLEAYSAGGARNAEYHGFRAALYQRMGRHREAVEEYEEALRLFSGNGAWWIGRGISLQSLERPKEALESFRRARLAGNMNPELTAFAEQRIRQLQ